MARKLLLPIVVLIMILAGRCRRDRAVVYITEQDFIKRNSSYNRSVSGYGEPHRYVNLKLR